MILTALSSRRRALVLPGLLLTVTLLFPPAPLAASNHEKTWVGLGSPNTFWSRAANWDPAGLPDANSAVFFSTTIPSRVSLDLSPTVESITYNSTTDGLLFRAQSTGGTIDVLTVSGSFNMDGLSLEFVDFTSPNAGRRFGVAVGTLNLTRGTTQIGGSRGLSAGFTADNTQFTGANAIDLIADFRVENFPHGGINLGEVTMANPDPGGQDFTISIRSTPDQSQLTVASLAGGDVDSRIQLQSQATANGQLLINGPATATFSGILQDNHGTHALSLLKEGTGSQTLDAANSYSGGTTLTGGTLVGAHDSAFGGGAIDISGTTEAILEIAQGVNLANAVVFSNTHADSLIRRDLANTESFNTGTGTLSTDFGNSQNTTVAFLGGTAGGNRTLEIGFQTNSTASNDQLRISDVLVLTGTESDLFVLQMEVDQLWVESFLGWHDGDKWVNAVQGNSATGQSAMAGFEGSFADSEAQVDVPYLGSWGYDLDNHAVWAILDHNSQFAVIPEPSAMGLAFLGGLLWWFGARRRTGS